MYRCAAARGGRSIPHRLSDRPAGRRVASGNPSPCSRILLVSWGILACLLSWPHDVSAQGGKLRGYAGLTSVVQGESIEFHVSDLAGVPGKSRNVPIAFLRKGIDDEPVDSGTIAVRNEGLAADLSVKGAAWPAGYVLKVPASWPSGLYAARLGDAGDDRRDILFVVRSAKPGSSSSVVVALPWTTANAYSNWGGSSLYAFNSAGGLLPGKASFDRPLNKESLWPFGFGVEEEYLERLRPFMVWLEQSGYAVEYVTSVDLHADAELLAHYKVLVSIGHDEYWSAEMRDHVDAFVAAGGNVAVFSGNTAYWNIRFEPDEAGRPNRVQVCYKFANADPVSDPSRKTINWDALGRPENTTFGLGYKTGAYAANKAKPVGYTAYRTGHWVYGGTHLRDGDVFGAKDRLFTYETDALDFTTDPSTGLPVPTGRDQTPLELKVLALADLRAWPGQAGYAAMGIFSRPGGGTVFNGGTTQWSSGLLRCDRAHPLCNPVARITRNVLDHFNPITVTLQAARNEDAGDTLRYWLDTAVSVGSGWDFVGSAFNAYASPIDRDLVPVYRFHATPRGRKQLLSLDRQGPTNRGWTYDSIAFYAYGTPGDGRAAVHRVEYASETYGYLERYTTSPLLRAGETDRGPLFYVPVGTQAAPVYRNVVAHGDLAGTRRYWLADRYVGDRWAPDGIAFNALRTRVDPEAVPVFAWHATGEFGSKQVLRLSGAAPEGEVWTEDGVAFYAYALPRTGRVPVYRFAYRAESAGALERYATSPDPAPGESNLGIAFYTQP